MPDKATPRPWSVDIEGDTLERRTFYRIRDANGAVLVHEEGFWDQGINTMRAIETRFRFIVEAVNAHDRLQRMTDAGAEVVDVARWAIDVIESFLKGGLPERDGGVQMYLEEVERSRQAIAAYDKEAAR